VNTVHNERIKLLATAMNNLAVGAIISGIVVPLVRGNIDNLWSAFVWTGVGLPGWRR
jgi:hypothetical protein